MKITNKKPKVYSAMGVTLMPGSNVIPDELAKNFLEHPHVKIKIKQGWIEVGSSTVRDEEADDDADGVADNEKEPGDLEEGEIREDEPKTAAEILDAIPTMFDVVKLREYAENGTKKVKKAAKARLKDLEEQEAELGEESDGDADAEADENLDD